MVRRYSYWSDRGQAYWLSIHGDYSVNTKSCPGERFEYIQTSSYCGAEKWTITAAGKESGVPLEHLDVITLKGREENSFFNRHLDYIIFKWGYKNIYDV